MIDDLRYLVFLNDGETYTEIEGCVLVGLRADNHQANDALEDEDFEVLFEAADIVTPIEPPTAIPRERTSSAR